MSKQQPLVSVVIPVFNGERFLKETIQSVLDQTYPNIECIVVNDGSTDGTGDVARSFSDRIRYFAKQNGGVSSARNFGVANSNGEYIAFLDADDLWLTDKTEKQMSVMIEDHDIGMTYTASVSISEVGEILSTSPALSQVDLIKEVLLLGPATGRISSTGIISRRVLETAGRFDERLSTSADADLLLRLNRITKIVGLNQPLVQYRLHGGQMHRNLQALERDMKRVLDTLFLVHDSPDWITKLKGRAYSSLASTLAVGYLSLGQYQKAVKFVGNAIRFHPGVFLSHIRKLAVSKLNP